MERKYFAVIVGAGPAGTFLAKFLASKGKPVAILDKQNFPRYKPCGGGISAKANELLLAAGINYDDIIQHRINTVTFTNRCEQPVDVTFDNTLISMVMRDELDNLMLQQAVNAGAEVFTGCDFKSATVQKNGVLIETSSGNFSAAYLIGADGANSKVGKQLKLKIKPCLGFAVECELETAKFASYQNRVLLDHGHISQGYGWVFPKKNHLSVGIGSFSPKVRSYRNHLNQFLDCLDLEHNAYLTKGHLIPTPTKKRPQLHGDNTLVIGDAAGLADPLTGEGIYFALRSAQIAGEALIKEQVPQYSIEVNNIILPELIQAGRVARFIYAVPGTVHNLISKNNDLARTLVGIVYGGDNYNKLWKLLVKTNFSFATVK